MSRSAPRSNYTLPPPAVPAGTPPVSAEAEDQRVSFVPIPRQKESPYWWRFTEKKEERRHLSESSTPKRWSSSFLRRLDHGQLNSCRPSTSFNVKLRINCPKTIDTTTQRPSNPKAFGITACDNVAELCSKDRASA